MWTCSGGVAFEGGAASADIDFLTTHRGRTVVELSRIGQSTDEVECCQLEARERRLGNVRRAAVVENLALDLGRWVLTRSRRVQR
ncbi:unnamed protein product [Calypogeia fissa]